MPAPSVFRVACVTSVIVVAVLSTTTPAAADCQQILANIRQLEQNARQVGIRSEAERFNEAAQQYRRLYNAKCTGGGGGAVPGMAPAPGDKLGAIQNILGGLAGIASIIEQNQQRQAEQERQRQEALRQWNWQTGKQAHDAGRASFVNRDYQSALQSFEEAAQFWRAADDTGNVGIAEGNAQLARDALARQREREASRPSTASGDSPRAGSAPPPQGVTPSDNPFRVGVAPPPGVVSPDNPFKTATARIGCDERPSNESDPARRLIDNTVDHVGRSRLGCYDAPPAAGSPPKPPAPTKTLSDDETRRLVSDKHRRWTGPDGVERDIPPGHVLCRRDRNGPLRVVPQAQCPEVGESRFENCGFEGLGQVSPWCEQRRSHFGFGSYRETREEFERRKQREREEVLNSFSPRNPFSDNR